MASAAALVATAAFLTGCGGSETKAAFIDPGDGGNYRPVIEPARFTARITNPLLPFTPGSRWVYESTDGSERIVVEVLAETRTVMGIPATVVHDVVYDNGEIIEDTLDWYAQDSEGNVWYLGEDSKEMKDGKVVSTHGSWEAGVDGALPGIVMLAAPSPAKAYRQEFYKGEAEDLARVERLSEKTTVPFGTFDGLVVIAEWTPLDASVVEEKYYARGVGLVAEVKIRGGEGRLELKSFEPGR